MQFFSFNKRTYFIFKNLPTNLIFIAALVLYNNDRMYVVLVAENVGPVIFFFFSSLYGALSL